MKERIVGIDLGTTNSAIAIVQDGAVNVLQINGQPTMPSCVGIDPTGQLVVGQAAKNQLVAAPESTVQSVKRRMGENDKVTLGDRSFSPEEISSLILRELKQEAEKQLGESVTKAVITVPAFFNENQRKATQVAGELAGLEVLRIINEPTAAALAYGAGNTPNERMLVYDLGGGTFDVSVVVVEDGVVEVKSSHGDTRLGGDDFDNLLLDHVAEQVKEEKGVTLNLDTKTRVRLKEIVERAKRELSDSPFARIQEEYVDGEHHIDLEIERHRYEELIQPMLEKTVNCMHEALKDAGLRPSDINRVMLVGGSTRTPLVQRLQKERLQLEPHSEISPDLIVAMGAAIQAGTLSGETQHSVLVDITPHTYSIESLQLELGPGTVACTPILPRNTALPASKAEVFETIRDNQEAVDIKVYQGEFPFPEQNTLIGEFRVEGLSHKPAGNLILVHFSLDLNGMLQVTATEKQTGVAKSVTLDTRGQGRVNIDEARDNIAAFLKERKAGHLPEGSSPALAADSDIESMQEEEASMSEADAISQNGDESETGDDAQSDQLLTTAKDLRKRANALLETNISDEDKEEIQELVQQTRQAISDKDWKTVHEKNDSLSDLLFYLED